MYISSSWIANKSRITINDEATNQDEKCRFFCEQKLQIDEGSSNDIHKDMMFCDNLRIEGTIENAKSVMIVSNQSNLSDQNFQRKITADGSIEFGHINKTKESYNDVIFSDVPLFYQLYPYSYSDLSSMLLINYQDTQNRKQYFHTLWSYIIEKDVEKANYEQVNSDVFSIDLVNFLDDGANRHFIEDSLEILREDTSITLFSRKQWMQDMTIFEFLFFKCKYYQIAEYVKDVHGVDDDGIFSLIVGTDFFDKHDEWTVSTDRSEKLFTKQPPSKCESNIVYEYKDDAEITKSFEGGKAVQMLGDTNLILQYIDQRKLYETNNVLIININVHVEHKNEYGGLWRFNLSDFKFEIGHSFNWKIDRNTQLTCDTMYISSVWITNKS